MGIVEDIFKNKTLAGLAIGLGAAAVAPKLIPVVGQAVKPVAKALIKSGFLFFEKGKEAAAELGESIEDMWAEVQAEIEEEHTKSTLAAPVEEGEKTS